MGTFPFRSLSHWIGADIRTASVAEALLVVKNLSPDQAPQKSPDACARSTQNGHEQCIQN